MSEYFPKSKCLRTNLKLELDLPNYGTTADEKIQRELILHLSLKKIYLANLKSHIDKLDIDN